MNDEDELSEVLKPSSPGPEKESPISEPSELQLAVQSDEISKVNRPHIPSQEMAGERGGNLTDGESPVAPVDGDAVPEALEHELASKDESVDVCEELPLRENCSSWIPVAEAEIETKVLVKNAGIGEITNDSNSIRDAEVEEMLERDGESEIVKEVEAPVVDENQDELEENDSEGKDNGHDNLKAEEVTEVSELSIEWTGEAASEIETKREERTGEEEILEPPQLPERTEEDGETSFDDEVNVVLKEDDYESKKENEALIVKLQGDGFQTVCKGKIVGEKHSRKDNCDLGVNGNTESKGEENPAQMDENAGSHLVGDTKEVGVKELSQEDLNDFRMNGNTEPRVEVELSQIDEIAGSPLVSDKDKDIDGEDDSQENDDPLSIASQDEVGEEDEVAAGGTPIETEGETETDTARIGSGGKRKRGRTAKVSGKTSKILVGEDVCFICLDGGDLVLCDRRGCPKAYHPSCVDRDEAFFRAKGRWNCGCHLCSKCEKNAYYMCCTCPFSLCKGCIKDAVIFCLRGNKGLCETCIKTVMLIENNEQGNVEMAVFDDKSQWEYLFKDYWIEQKEKFSFTAEEIAQAKNPWRGFDGDNKQGTPARKFQVNSKTSNASNSSLADAEAINFKRKKMKKPIKSGKDVGSDTDSSSVKPDGSNTKRKAKRWLKPLSERGDSDSDNSTRNREKAVTRGKKTKKMAKSHANEGALVNQLAEGKNSSHGNTKWASKELLEFVLHMKNGDGSVLSQFDVQELLLEYIKRNKLRDPRRRSQIVCDPMLEKLFGKPRVGHFEMLKLLESHFLMKNDSQAEDNQGSIVDTEVSQMDVDENASALRGREMRKKGDRRLQSNLDDYAAIDMHNLTLIYLRRNLMEALLEDSERFQEKVVGSFVRIRISGTMLKQDLYRLVQVVGTGKAAEQYKVGKRTTYIMLEILNLDKTELISIDSISNQEFSEDECKRLRQSIKCGLSSRLTVGDILGKAEELHQVRVTDWLETEIVRLRHLCDRASDLGHKRELRENVEKLQLLKTPEERRRRLDEIPVVHADPNMDPSHDSDDESPMENKRQEINMRQRESGSFRRGGDQHYAQKGGYSWNDSWNATAIPPNRNLSGKGFSGRGDDSSHVAEMANRSSWHQGPDRGTPRSNNWEKPRPSVDSTSGKYTDSGVRNKASLPGGPEPSQHPSAVVSQIDAKINETDKLWHYRDPSGKVQGPFSMVQLRKWNNSGFFPSALRIWKTTETEDDSILLTSALARKFQREPSIVSAFPSDPRGTGMMSHLLPADTGKPQGPSSQHTGSSLVPPVQSQLMTRSSLSDLSSKGSTAPSSMVSSHFSTEVRSSDSGSKHDSLNLQFPNPNPNPPQTRKRSSVSRWSQSIVPNQSSSDVIVISESKGGNGVLPSSAHAVVDSGITQVTRSSNPPPSSEPRTVIATSHVPTNAQQMSSQSAAVLGEGQKVQVTTNPLPSQNNAIQAQGVPNMVQSGAVQNPSAYGWGSGYGARPVMGNPSQSQMSQAWGSAAAGPQNIQNMIPAQQQQQQQQPVYGYWFNAPPVNSQPPQSYGSGQFQGAGNFSNQSFSGIPSQNQWRPQVSTNMPWGTMASSDNPGAPPPSSNSNTAWGSMPTNPNPNPNPNMGWVGPSPGIAAGPAPGAPSSGQVGQPPGRPANVPQGSTHHNKPGQGGYCRFHENGHCKKGASCYYLHS
ncbi:hypothetical protein Dimus_026009 [Dionaea muscipula]